VTRFSLAGDASSTDLAAVRLALVQLVGSAAVTETPGGLHVEGVMDGNDARDANRRLLSALRRIERRTTLRAEWTGGGLTYRFFDYVPKGTRTTSPAE
jgi:hypothetical protein